MSERNYRHIEGFPLGKYRREVEPVLKRPELDDEGFLKLLDWRDESLHGRPFLDDLNGHYLFHPSPNGVKAYTENVPKPKMPKRDPTMLVKDLDVFFSARRHAKEATKRQPKHVAEGAENALALFWSVAVGRSAHISNVLAKVTDQQSLIGNEEIETSVAFAADAIIDLGMCLEEPVETVYVPGRGRKPRVSNELKAKFDTFSPDIGSRIIDYGSYLTNNPEGFASADGVILLQAAYDEQDRRIDTWAPRHKALEQQYPELEVSQEVLMMRVPLQEMLFQIDELENRR